MDEKIICGTEQKRIFTETQTIFFRNIQNFLKLLSELSIIKKSAIICLEIFILANRKRKWLT